MLRPEMGKGKMVSLRNPIKHFTGSLTAGRQDKGENTQIGER